MNNNTRTRYQMAEKVIVNEVPDCVKKLIRLVVRTFEMREDSLIVDLLIRYSCLSERQLKELLKFDGKLLRQRLTHLKTRKFIQTRVRMEAGALKVIYYYLHYVNFINVVQYKLLMMRKKLENVGRVVKGQAYLECSDRSTCGKEFMVWEIGECFNIMDRRFYCTFCKSLAEHVPRCRRKDTQSKIFIYNESLVAIFELLKECQSFSYDSSLMNPLPYSRGPAEIKIKVIEEKQTSPLPLAFESRLSLSDASTLMKKKRFDGKFSVVVRSDAEDEPINSNYAPNKELPPWLVASVSK